MTSKLTREQTQQIIDAADAVISALAGTNDEVHKDDTDKMIRLWDDLNDRYAPPEVVRELARMALAAMESEPVAWIWQYREQWHVTSDPRRAEFVAKDGDVEVFPLYRHAQPGPVVDREPVEESVTCWSCRNEVEISAIGDRDGYCPICDAPIDLDEEPYTSPQPAPERDQVRSEHAEWSQATFGNVGPVGPLKHLSKEALEAAAEPADLSEWADMQFLLWDAQRRAGITDEQITQAMIKKLAVNKQREWPEPKDSEPRLHIKEQPAAVGPVTDAMAYAFHHALTDGPLGDDDVEDIKTGLRAAFANVTTYQPLPVVLKEHQIRELVNKLRDIAIEYHGTQQLREHIACVIRTAISAVAPPAPKSAVN
ncbi:Eaa1 [Klebsiella pneumoniae]|nr:Eaa1 [Klebsiella pneumoniae]SVU98128.1 Eaa1 [Klebsiella pneumoniae]